MRTDFRCEVGEVATLPKMEGTTHNSTDEPRQTRWCSSLCRPITHSRLALSRRLSRVVQVSIPVPVALDRADTSLTPLHPRDRPRSKCLVHAMPGAAGPSSAGSSNWKNLHARLSGGSSAAGKKRKRDAPSAAAPKAAQPTAPPPSATLASPAPPLPVTPVSVADAVSPRVALDAEMVGVGEGGKRSALARIVIVGFDERICYSAFVRPPETVTDWRTAVSGVRPEHMAHALPLRRVQAEVAALLRDRTIIGHGLHNDLKALMLEHPRLNIRDTATYPAYRKQLVQGTRPRRLQALALEFLGWHIQGAEHSPAEDAVAALRLYKLRMSDWERALGKRGASERGNAAEQLHTQTSGWERALKKGKVRKFKRGTGGGRRRQNK